MTERKPDRISGAITVNGRDRRGVVAKVTQHLFESKANIESLEEQVKRGKFHMNVLCSWNADRLDAEARERIAKGLEAIGDEIKMEIKVRFHEPGARQRMAVLVTLEKHCLEAILEADAEGALKAKPVVVIGNRRNLEPVAKEAGIPFVHIPWHDPPAAEDQLKQTLEEHDVDLVVLARFMRILSPGFCWRYRNRIINIHPSLLPAFPGAQAYRQAWEKGVHIVGVTAHFVTPDLDQGPIIYQDAFRIDPTDSVSEVQKKGRELEAKVLVEAIDRHVSKRLDVHWGRVWAE